MKISTGFPLVLPFINLFLALLRSHTYKRNAKCFEYIISCIRMIWDCCRKTTMFILPALNYTQAETQQIVGNSIERIRITNVQRKHTIHLYTKARIQTKHSNTHYDGLCVLYTSIRLRCDMHTLSTLFHRLTQAHWFAWAYAHNGITHTCAYRHQLIVCIRTHIHHTHRTHWFILDGFTVCLSYHTYCIKISAKRSLLIFIFVSLRLQMVSS